MEEERKKLRVIHVFDKAEDATKELERSIDVLKEIPDTKFVIGERLVLMHLANNVCSLMILFESNQISKAELDLYLRKKPIHGRFFTNVSPLDFDFVFESSINNRLYTNWYYLIDDLISNNVDSSMMEPYFELSIIYSFDSIFEQMQKMVTDFKAAHKDFEKMTNNERLQRFWSWQGNEDYIYYDFFDNLLDECKKTYTRRNHEHRSNKGGH